MLLPEDFEHYAMVESQNRYYKTDHHQVPMSLLVTNWDEREKGRGSLMAKIPFQSTNEYIKNRTYIKLFPQHVIR